MSPPKPRTYTQLSESQLGWFHIAAQWICIRILYYYFNIFYSMRVLGKENRPKNWQSYIIAANHTSSLDPPLISVALQFQPISYMAKLELFQNPIMRLYNWSMSSFAVNREKLDISTVKTALKVLKHGQWALGLFPEGSRNKDGETLVNETKKGVAYFAKAAQVPVLPVGVYQSKRRICVAIGPLIPAEADMDVMGEKIRQAMVDLVAQAKACVNQPSWRGNASVSPLAARGSASASS